MADNPFRHVRSGEPLVIPATTYNAMVDATQIVRNRRINLAPHGTGFDSLFVHVVNTTGKTLRRFDVLGLDGPLATSEIDTFCERIVFNGVVPQKEHKGKFVVLQEDAEPDICVRACAYGVSIAKIKVEPEDGERKRIKFCDITENETGYLKSGGNGAEVLWSDDSAEDRWAIIRIGSGSSSLFPVVMEKVGGEPGDHENQCDFKYDIYDFPKNGGDNPIEKTFDLNGENSRFKRPELGKFKEADFGIALWDGDKLNIVWCNEVMAVKSCSNSDESEEETRA